MFQTDSTRPSWVARSIVPVSKAFHGVVVVNDFLEPLMHIISDLMREKFSLYISSNLELCCMFCHVSLPALKLVSCRQ